MIHAFPKIFHIGKDYIKDIFNDEVEVTSKIDGSQWIFGKVKGDLYMRSKGCMQYAEKHDKMFNEAVDYIVSIKDRLPNDTVFYSEYLKTPRHNTLKYDRIPKNHLALFGVMFTSEKFVSDYEKLKQYAEMLDIDVVPLVYRGKINNAQELMEMLNQEEYLGGCKREGVVVKNYNQPFLLGGQPIPVMSGKYVSEAFKEVHRKTWNKEHTAKGRFDIFKKQYCTEARWLKAIQHLKEKGELTNEPRDIGKLLKEIQEDVIVEEKENIKEQLWKIFNREILGTASRGFPEFYKKELIKRQFENES